MRIFTCVVAATFIAFLGTGDALADAEAGQGYFSIMGSYIDDDKDRGVEDDINGGQLGFGYAINDAFNIEAIFSAAWPDGDTAAGLTRSISALASICSAYSVAAERFSPYLHAGIGYIDVDSESTGHDDGGMYSAGAGFLLDLFDSNLALRGEWRHRMETASIQNRNDDLFSLGFQIPVWRGHTEIRRLRR